MDKPIDKAQQEIQESTLEWISLSQYSQEFVDILIEKIAASHTQI